MIILTTLSYFKNTLLKAEPQMDHKNNPAQPINIVKDINEKIATLDS